MSIQFENAQNKLILQATRVAGNYLLSKYGSAHLVGEPKVELSSTIDPNSSSLLFQGKITVYAASDGLLNQVGINMTVNNNDIEVESEDIQASIVEALNASQELEPVKASLDGFKLIDDGSKYMKVAHKDLEESNLGIVGKSEYAASPDRSELLQTIVKDAMARVANETTINFEGSFVEPVIEKIARGCDQCDAAMINGVFCHETGCPNARREKERERFENSDEYLFGGEEVESAKKSSWLSDMEMPTENDHQHNFGRIDEMGKAHCVECDKTEEETGLEPLTMKENMPRASMSDTLAQSMQSEQQMHTAAQEKIKNEAVNSLVSMLQGMGYGSSKIAEVSMSDSKIDAMVTLDHAGTTKAVNIPVSIVDAKVVLPKKSLVSELINKGLDIRAKLSESFSQEILEKIAKIEELENYKESEANAILAERPTVTKTAGNTYDNTQFLGDQDVLVLNKFLVPDWENMSEGDTLSDGASSWSLVSKNSQQNSRGEDDGSQWSFKKVAPPETDKEPKEQIKI